jgi:hypothetical protein
VLLRTWNGRLPVGYSADVDRQSALDRLASMKWLLSVPEARQLLGERHVSKGSAIACLSL